MFHAAFEYLYTGERVLDALNVEANDKIITRGYSPSASVPSDLSNPNWFLPVNLLAYSYCPTNRYLYLNKIEKVQLDNTWKRYKGYVIDDLLPKVFGWTYSCLQEHSLRNLNLPSDLTTELCKMVAEYKNNFDPKTLVDPPIASERDRFFNFLPYLVNYEGLMASAFIAHRVTNILDLNLEKDFNLMFPFSFKTKFNARGIGIYPEAEVDFIYAHNILGEIKSQEWQEFYNLALAAYALAYEFDKKKRMNLGLVICPVRRRRKVPFYNNTARIKVIEESWRKAFLANRNQRIKLIRDGVDPGRPETNERCVGCGYLKRCWEE